MTREEVMSRIAELLLEYEINKDETVGGYIQFLDDPESWYEWNGNVFEETAPMHYVVNKE